MGEVYFPYGQTEIAYLQEHDKQLAPVIDIVGHVNRAMDPDLFCAVVHHIIGQQISTAAQQTVWARMRAGLGAVTPQTVAASSIEQLQAFGMTFRKAAYIQDFARRVTAGDFDLDGVAQLPDDQAIAAFCQLKGVGTWTAEMILLFSLGRSDVLSFGDLAIQRGMRMVYHHRAITPQLFARYRRRLSPYGSVASLYFWEVSHGAVPGLVDHAPQK